MREVTPPGTPSPSRRVVALGALGVAVASLTGCGIRLEDDAPHVPLVPDRSPIPGEQALLHLLSAVHAAALAPVDPRTPLSPLLAPLHRTQATVLHDALRQRGVPEDELPSGTPTPTPSLTSSAPPQASTTTASSPTPSSTGSPPPPPPTQAVAIEETIISAGAGCAEAAEDLRPTVVAILGQAHAAVDLAGPGFSAPTTAPPTWSTPEVLVPLLEAVRTSTYDLQVAAARSSRSVRDEWAVGIGRLERLTAELVAAIGDGAPAPDLGRPLPHPVTTAAEAATLATEALSTVLSTFGRTLRSLTDADPEAAFAVVPGWLGTVAAQARRHGVPLTAFPGLA
ncbi:hypothetical protein [Knoellia sp. Soil729]|uniref:hypothetical protein n=1 Tax=Knoellia sp. Soil729 TaxID=1736394 RepID=UPI0006F95BF1|nr:hypothetical protein [Knoellia sp. Soil729]KRE41862.1 hypothetical protein ASG74_05065 [Knoellia sp. Soil729]